MTPAAVSTVTTHPLSGAVAILTTRGIWYRICPSRTAFGVEGRNRRGGAVLHGASMRNRERRA